MLNETVEVKLKPLSKKCIPMDGQFSNANPHTPYKIEISATNKSHVKHEIRLLGNKDKYNVVIDVTNDNDSPAFVTIVCGK